MSKVMLTISNLLIDPIHESCTHDEADKLYRNNREEFNKIAKEWTLKYAMKKNPCF